MTAYVCATCGTQYPPSDSPPGRCPICEDERQYIGARGQRWTTLDDLRRGHDNSIHQHEPDLLSVMTTPGFAINQRAFLIRTGRGNVLWDCLALLDDATVTVVRALGGLSAIAFSHPHYYTTMVEWSETFDAPVLIHRSDAEWVQRPHPSIRFGDGEREELEQGVTLINTGGHFPGATVLHWPAGAEGRGVLLSGDTIQGVADSRWVSFMYSYPNLVPLGAQAVERIAEAVRPLRYERLYGAFAGRIVPEDAAAAVQRSARRYIAAVRA
jgi:glyoxylase-like metal-dependent hydrolase (beta-lactamase superfamily II)